MIDTSQNSVFSLIEEISKESIRYRNDRNTLKALLKRIQEVFPSDFACLALLENRHNNIQPWICINIEGNNFPKLKIGQESLSYEAVKSKRPQSWKVGDRGIKRLDYCNYEVNSEVVVPIVFENLITGVIVLGSRDIIDYRVFYDALMAVASQWAVVFQQMLFIDLAVEVSNLNFLDESKDEIIATLATTACKVGDSPIATVRFLEKGEKGRYLKLQHCEGSDDTEGLEKELYDKTFNDPSWETFRKAEGLLRTFTHEGIKSFERSDPHVSIKNRDEQEVLKFARPFDDFSEFKGSKFDRFIKENQLQSMVTVPIISGTEVMGVINTYSRRTGGFTEKQHYFLILLAGNAGDALKKESLRLANEELKKRALEKAGRLLAITRKTSFFTFTRHVNHEVKNLLFQLANELKIVEERVLHSGKHDERRRIVQIHDKSKRLAKQIIKIVNQYQVENNQIDVIDINDVIKEHIEFFDYTVSGNHIYIKSDLSQSIPNTLIDVDILNIVFYNLMSNAVDAIPIDQPGIIKIESWSEGDFIHVKVSDNGKGIPNELKNKIYEPYFSTKTVGEEARGTGLGLSHVRSLLNSVGGTIDHSSSVGKGTIFNITIPIQ